MVVVQAECPTVECLVVVGAEGEAVLLGVRAAVAVPVDVRGFGSDDPQHSPQSCLWLSCPHRFLDSAVGFARNDNFFVLPPR